MSALRSALKRERRLLLLWAVLALTDLAVFLLYRLPPEPFLYALALTAFFPIVVFVCDLAGEKKKQTERARMLSAAPAGWNKLPVPDTAAEADLQAFIGILGRALENVTADSDRERRDLIDSYTAWVHQIKTPIAVMRLKLSDSDPRDLALTAELNRIEQYADMVLQFARIGSGTNDLVIREYPLDDLVRESVRRLAPLFLERKLHFEFTPTGRSIITDRMWFTCILGQLLSNAVKYTPSGSVSVRAEGESLIVADTGIGIAPEDLPRIFERGYTGINGRTGRKSSGLGLYLAGKAANLLAIPLSVKSTPGKGSVFTMGLTEPKKA